MRAPSGAITSCTAVPAGSGGEIRMNIPCADRSCVTVRTRLPVVITSTGTLIAIRLRLRRTAPEGYRVSGGRASLVRTGRVTYGTQPMTWLELVDVSVALGGRDVIRGASAGVGPGDLVVVVGPNGAGKTTLLRALAGLVPVRTGAARIMGSDAARTPRRAIARELAYLPQRYDLAFPFAVEEVVLLGRYAQQRGLGLASAADLEAARAAMAACDVADLAARRFDELSGGEARRVIVAQALCQGARCLLLDEPTAGLDPRHARALFQ